MGRMQIFFYGDKTTASASRTILPKQSYAVLPGDCSEHDDPGIILFVAQLNTTKRVVRSEL